MSRPIALLSALGTGFALYKRAHGVAVGLALVSLIALRSIATASPETRRSSALRGRSSSLPDLRYYLGTGSLRPVEIVSPSTSHLIECSPSLPPPQEERIHLNQLPRVELSLWETYLGPPVSSQVVIANGVVDLRGVSAPLLDWNSFYGTGPLSLEIGHLFGAVARTAKAGGQWALIATDWESVRQVQREAGDKPLILLNNNWHHLGFLPKGRFKRIDLRLISPEFLIEDQALEEGGELRCIYEHDDLSNQVKCQEKMGAADRFLVVPESFPELHLIYRKGNRETQPGLVKLSQLPQRESFLWWVHNPFPTSLEIVNGIVDLRATASIALDWDEIFAAAPLSLELGAIASAVPRTLRSGGEWVVMTDCLKEALTVRRARQGGLTQPLILLGNNWSSLSLLPEGRFQRIDLRFPFPFRSKDKLADCLLSGQQIACFAEALGEEGELRLIFEQSESKLDSYRAKVENSGRFEFLKSERVEEKITMVVTLWLEQTRDSDQIHLIYRKVR